MPTLTAGKTAPPFELPGLEGKKHSLQDALTRGPVLATFFKVECPTCQYTFPFIERLYQQFLNKGIRVWGISQDETRETRGFAKDYGITFPLLIDEHPYETSRQYGLKYVPTLFLIAPDRQVELMSEGFCKADLLQIQKAIAKRLSVTPQALFPPRENVPEYKPG